MEDAPQGKGCAGVLPTGNDLPACPDARAAVERIRDADVAVK
jgi:hypothetical protein